jgi:hypothetical protein
MTESSSEAIAVHAPVGPADARRPAGPNRRVVSIMLLVFVVGNGVALLYIWASGGEDGVGYHWHSLSDALLSLGRLTAFLAGYLALIEVLLLARLTFLERVVGFDRLTVWHRWNGHAVIYLALAHVVFSVWGYARIDGNSWFQEYRNWLTLPQHASASPGGSATSGCLSISCVKPASSSPRRPSGRSMSGSP